MINMFFLNKAAKILNFPKWLCTLFFFNNTLLLKKSKKNEAIER